MAQSNDPTTVHEKLYEDTVSALNLLFGDNTVSPNVTRDSLLELRGEINVMLEALGDDPEEEAVSDEELLEEDEPEDDEEEQ